MTKRDKEAFYFGETGRQLFGCYHYPQGANPKSSGVVFCYPMGQEYMRFHRAYVQLASRLARAGYPVLRFDYFGCGDSYGEHEEARLGQWVENTLAAIEELERRSTVVKLSLIGARVGATVAALAAARRPFVDRLVLWNPVVDGRAHRQELAEAHQEMLRYSYVDERPGEHDPRFTELLGFSFGPELLSDVESVDLLKLEQKPAERILVLDSAGDATSEPFARHLQERGAQVDFKRFDGPQLWVEEPYKAVVPNALWQHVTAWLSDERR